MLWSFGLRHSRWWKRLDKPGAGWTGNLAEAGTRVKLPPGTVALTCLHTQPLTERQRSRIIPAVEGSPPQAWPLPPGGTGIGCAGANLVWLKRSPLPRKHTEILVLPPTRV